MKKKYDALLERIINEPELRELVSSIEELKKTENGLMDALDKIRGNKTFAELGDLNKIQSQQYDLVALARINPEINFNSRLIQGIVVEEVQKVRASFDTTALKDLNPDKLFMLSVEQCEGLICFLEERKKTISPEFLEDCTKTINEIKTIYAHKKALVAGFEEIDTKKSLFKNIADNTYCLIRVPNTSRYYAVDFSRELGKGAFGSIYEVYAVNPKTGAFGEKFALKIVENHKKAQREQKMLRKVFKTERPFKLKHRDHGGSYLITEFVPGNDLGKHEGGEPAKFQLDKAVKNLPLKQRVKAFSLLALDLYRIHYPTTRGRAMLHRDIKPGNIRILVKNNKVEAVRCIDFGFAQKVKARTGIIEGSCGSLGYAAPEVLQRHISGRKSDVRSLLPVVLALFGVEQPLLEVITDFKPFVREFSIEGLFNGMEAEISAELRSVIIAFFKRMESFNYDDRPDTDEVLRFATMLENYCQVDEVIKQEPEDVGQLESLRQRTLETLQCLAEPKTIFDKDALPESPQDQWALFLYASQNYEGNEVKWKAFAEEISKNIGVYTGKQTLKFLYEISRHNTDGAHDEIKARVEAELVKGVDEYVKTSNNILSNVNAKILKRAVQGKFLFFDSQKYINAAIKGEKNDRVLDVVDRIGVAAPAA